MTKLIFLLYLLEMGRCIYRLFQVFCNLLTLTFSTLSTKTVFPVHLIYSTTCLLLEICVCHFVLYSRVAARYIYFYRRIYFYVLPAFYSYCGIIKWQGPRKIVNGGSPYSYMRILPLQFLLKLIAFTVCEPEYMNMGSLN